MNFYSEDRSYTQYFHEVSRARMPANGDEERELFRRYHEKRDQIARKKIVEGGLRFVIRTAKQYYRGDNDFLKTLIAAGNVGLMVAVDRYMPWVIRCPKCQTNNYVPQPKRQRCNCGRPLRAQEAQHYTTRFLTYAAWWICEAIRAELYASSLVHIPPYKQKEHHRQRQAGQEVGFNYVPFDDISDQIIAHTEDDISVIQTRKMIYNLLSSLKDRHAYVLIAYFGIREEAKTLREIAQKLGVCSERVRQIKVEAMDELRKRLIRQNIYKTIDLCTN